ncbi:MAG: AarF/ABC1/UbiB kinase family protein [Actinobacteria bacterium]|nr:AarF/ABC1/UbiB kinase family protein [Actinomycetota bacterium]
MASIISQIGYRLAVSRQYRNRYREITSTLLRHGFGFLVVQLGLARFVPFQYGILGHPRRVEPYTQAEHVRLIFEDLGTTFIKLGQILSTRTDLLPPEYIHELEKLLDRVPPTSIELIQSSIEQELGRNIDEIFLYFDPEPLASASIGQVHAAVLKTGEDVVVKVKRPGVSEQVSIDIDITTDLARLAARRLPAGRNYDFEGIVREFTQTLLRELDYVQEGRNADRFRDNFAGDERVYIPHIHWDYTTEGVIVMERISGIRITDKDALQSAGLDPKIIAKQSSEILLEQVFEHGFFHADPHPANFFVMADGIIGIVDFGMVGYLDQETKASLVELFIAVSEQDPDGIIDSYIDLGVIGRIERFGMLRSEISALIMQYYGLSIEEVNIRSVLDDVTSLVRRHNLRMPANLALLTKTVGMEEGLVINLDPSFKFAEAMAPFAKKVWEETYSPQALARRTLRSIVDLIYIGVRAPRQIRHILGQVSRGELTIITNQPRLDEELSIINSAVNRLIFGIITAATLITAGLMLPFFSDLIRRRRRSKTD